MTNHEKRKHSRYSSINLSYVCLDEDQQVIHQFMGKTLNISEDGLLLETHFPIDMLSTLILSIGLQDDLVEIKGKVSYCRPLGHGKYGIGIKILEVNGESRSVWQRFIQSVAFNQERLK